MKEILIFKNVEEAVNILKKYDKKIEKKEMSKEEVVRKSISSNIFRAFHKLNKKPSEIYREWATKNIDLIINKLNNTQTKEEYDKNLFGWINSFINHWESQTDEENKIIFGPASKMVNLLIKTLNESKIITNDRLMQFFHVPFDLYSLKPLIKIINKISDVNYKIDIPKNPTMKFITNPEIYWIIQNSVFKLCKNASISPILYDYWCWNEKH
ncbi:MAG: hypothetical protein Q8N63_02580 [Nanoarchaeota archaeon]|nr:hypothetical protein [Nanoarchaeota archaeon]